MPLIDKPLEELKRYTGSSPKPKDFEAYWERALRELDATDPCVELVEAPFHVPGALFYDLYFTGVHGARVHAKFGRPAKVDAPVPAVLQFHGYSGHSGDWSHLVGYVQTGFAAFAMDARGQGGKSEDVGGVKGTTYHGHIIRGLDDPDPDRLLFRDIFLDTAQLARVAMAMDIVDATRVGCTGGSQGGALTLACASLEPRVARAYASYPFLCDYKRVWDMDLDVGAYDELRKYFRYYDPLHEREAEIFEKLGYIDLQYLSPRIRAKLVMVTGLMDTICPPSTQFAAFNRMTCDKRSVIYPDFGHEDLPGNSDRAMQFMCEMLDT